MKTKAAVALFLFGVGLGWTANGVKLTGKMDALRADYMTKLADSQKKHAAEAEALRNKLAALERDHHNELEKVRHENTRIVNDLERDIARLSIRVEARPDDRLPGSAEATSLDDDQGARYHIHPADAAAIVRITARADECRARLTALQDWVDSL